MEPAVGSMYTLTTVSGQLVSPLGVPLKFLLLLHSHRNSEVCSFKMYSSQNGKLFRLRRISRCIVSGRYRHLVPRTD